MKRDLVLIALAGQPNCGKSTVFNALTGASQHVANYPGVTVEKMTGRYNYDGLKVEVVDLPGTYSLTSYSLEERVTRGFLLEEKPSVVVNVADASNLTRNLYLTLQLLEMEIPLVMDLNMMDVADRRGIKIDPEKLARHLGASVVQTAIKTGRGKKELLSAISRAGRSDTVPRIMHIDYGPMEPFIKEIKDRLISDVPEAVDYPLRWLAIKIMEEDDEALKYIREKLSNPDPFLEFAAKKREDFESQFKELPARHMAYCRYQHAERIGNACLATKTGDKRPMSDKVDGVVCNRFLGPMILVGVLYLLYYLSIVQGYNLTNYTWPLLAKLRNITAALAPSPGFIEIPLLRAFFPLVRGQHQRTLKLYPHLFHSCSVSSPSWKTAAICPEWPLFWTGFFQNLGCTGPLPCPWSWGASTWGGARFRPSCPPREYRTKDPGLPRF